MKVVCDGKLELGDITVAIGCIKHAWKVLKNVKTQHVCVLACVWPKP